MVANNFLNTSFFFFFFQVQKSTLGLGPFPVGRLLSQALGEQLLVLISFYHSPLCRVYWGQSKDKT